MMSSLITLAAQGKQDYDLHIIFIEGDGKCTERNSYARYHEINARINEGNIQLSNDDRRILTILEATNFDVTFHYVENDHGLDSGAWLKFLHSNVWANYRYIHCYMEGFLFTRPSSFRAIKTFCDRHHPDFIDVGHEKTLHPRWLLENWNSRSSTPSEMDRFHDEQIRRIFTLFSEDRDFYKIYQEWWQEPRLRFSPGGEKQHHVPDQFYSWNFQLKEILKNIVQERSFVMPAQRLVATRPSFQKTRLRPLKNVVPEYIVVDNTIFHKEQSPYFFGCSCQHIFSNKFLANLSRRLEKLDMKSVLDAPFVGTALEPIWGMMPTWIGCEKWYFDGQHRPRKNFFTLEREDSSTDMERIINRYFHRYFEVKAYRDLMKLVETSTDLDYMRALLGDLFKGDHDLDRIWS
jgi:hypothetical protein